MTLAEALAQNGAPAASLDALTRYGEMLLEANSRVNLTAARTPEAIAEQIADAFVLAPLVQGALVDVGTGGGLPGIPLAILCGVPVTLIEATAKKAAFLSRVLEHVGLEGEAVAGRAETLAREPRFREHFMRATARAVGSAPTVLELTLPFLAPGGIALLQRGRIDERERLAVHDAALMLGGEVSEEIVAGNDRRVLVVRKLAPTPDRFPRRVGIPHRRPLCVS